MTRERLPPERPSLTRHFELPYLDEERNPQRFKFYAVASWYEHDLRLAELFIYVDRKTDQMAGLLAGMLDTIATTISIGLQYGVPMEVFVAKMRSGHFGPSGFTGDPEFKSCTSPLDLIAQWLIKTFPEGKYERQTP